MKVEHLLGTDLSGLGLLISFALELIEGSLSQRALATWHHQVLRKMILRSGCRGD